MLPTTGMKHMYEKLQRAMVKADERDEKFAIIKHRTYHLEADKSDSIVNVLNLYHYGTLILKIEFPIWNEVAVTPSIYSSSDRDAINALLIVLGYGNEYKFNIHAENVLKGGN